MTERKNTPDEIKKMRSEAIKRVRELHSRSKTHETSTIKEKEDFPQKNNLKLNIEKTNPLQQSCSCAKRRFKTQFKNFLAFGNSSNKTPNFIELLFKGADESLLIILIILLMDDKENFMVMLVLFYLLL